MSRDLPIPISRTNLRKLFCLAALLSVLAAAQPYASAQKRVMGLKIDDEKYQGLPRKSAQVRFKGALPAAYSIREYLPEIGDQGTDGTCVGWAAAYYMRTAVEAARSGLRNNPAEIGKIAFSPWWLYAKLKIHPDSNCADGGFLEDALLVMKNKGAAKLGCAPLSCGDRYEQCDAAAGAFRIADYATLFPPKAAEGEAKQRIHAIKSALVEGTHAVLVGIMVPPSFIEEATEHWRAAPGESLDNTLGAHAMAIVGYDDHINGGSFLVANSWGKSWGQDGYTWANCEDMIRFVRHAYQVFPESHAAAKPGTITLKGSVDFDLNGTQMPVQTALTRGLTVTSDQPGTSGGMVTYRMKQPYNSGTRFKMTIHNNKRSYVYILGSDQQNRVARLFPSWPEEGPVSAVVPANNVVTLPSSGSSFTLDDITGEDYFVILISEKELNADQVSEQIRNAGGSIEQKLYAALGREFIAAKDIAYQPGQIGYEVKGNPAGSVVPLLVKITHR